MSLKKIAVSVFVSSFAAFAGTIASAAEAVLYSFKGSDGSNPVGSLIGIGSGVLYGMTESGGDLSRCGGKGCGVVFELTPPVSGKGTWSQRILHVFKGGADGAAPDGSLLLDKSGALYGVTSQGGGGACHSYISYSSGSFSVVSFWKKGARIGCGTIFKLTPPAKSGSVWNETILHRLAGGSDGSVATGSLAMDKAAVLYGVTHSGGSGNCGFYSYHASTSISGPRSALEYKTGCGTVYKLTPPSRGGTVWGKAVLHVFNKTDGANPVHGVNVSNGIVGVTSNGMKSGEGNVFQLVQGADNKWKETVLYSFPQGSYPNGGISLDANNAIYSSLAGGNEGGAIFKLTPSSSSGKPWALSILYTFSLDSQKNGIEPTAGLGQDSLSGGFYGTTSAGGDTNLGTVYTLTPPAKKAGSWTEQVGHSFGKGTDGKAPIGRVLVDAKGHLYGMTSGGGASGKGTVYEITP